jgi:hypothetical protein
MFLTAFLVILLLIIILFTFKYLQWRYKIYQIQKRGIPLAYAHFVPALLPFAEYFGKPSSLESEKIIYETFKRTGSPFVLVSNGVGRFLIFVW